MHHDEQDKLWELLGKARNPKDRPFFAAKVMRAIRAEAPAREGGLLHWLCSRWFLPLAAGACAVAVVAVVMNQHPAIAPQDNPANIVAVKTDPLAELAFAVAESDEMDMALTPLIAAKDNSVWLVADPSSLY